MKPHETWAPWLDIFSLRSGKRNETVKTVNSSPLHQESINLLGPLNRWIIRRFFQLQRKKFLIQVPLKGFLGGSGCGRFPVYVPHLLHVWSCMAYLPTFGLNSLMVNVGKSSSAMEHLGYRNLTTVKVRRYFFHETFRDFFLRPPPIWKTTSFRDKNNWKITGDVQF